jgi:hypothetical protein
LARDFFDIESNFNDVERELLTLDCGWAKCALALREGLWFGHGRNEIKTRSLIEVWDELEARRNRFARGNTLELLSAIHLCAGENVPLPTWLANAYRQAINSFLTPGGPPSLDAVFHSDALPTGTHKQAERARQDWALGGLLWRETRQIAREHAGMDSALDSVLKTRRWGVGKTKARKLVEMVDRTHCELTGQDTLSRFWTKRRKLMRS